MDLIHCYCCCFDLIQKSRELVKMKRDVLLFQYVFFEKIVRV